MAQLEAWTETTRVELLGFSSWTAARVLEELRRGRKLGEMPGDFVLLASGRTEDGRTQELIATSAIGARPYFVVDRPGPPLHGRDVFRLVADAGLSWDWSIEALRGVAWLGHTVADQTLHPAVRRVPADSVLLHTNGTGSWSTETQDFWTSIFDGPEVDVDEAVDVLNEVTADLLGDDTPLLSLSAGFDSRALLSVLLASDKHPVAVTMGGNDATDVVVASEIADALQLEHRVIGLEADDYLPAANEIVSLTGGTKTLANWHTFLYPRGQPSGKHLVGSNGEFARSFYLDRGSVIARTFSVGGQLAVRSYWAARVERRGRRMAPWLPFLEPHGSLDRLRYSSRLASLSADGGGNGMDYLDRFYARERVRHFIGNGLALYAKHGCPVSPFLDARWVRAAAGLNRREKLGSNFHRRVIQRNYPALLAHPIGASETMAPVAPAGYWKQSSIPVSYSPASELLRRAEVTDILAESPHLRVLMPQHAVARVVATGTAEVKEFLLTTHFAGEAAAHVSS